MKNTVILIPAYKPDYKLIKTLEKLAEEDYALLVVDDGSGDAYDDIFIQAARYSRVIRYAKNRPDKLLNTYFKDCFKLSDAQMEKYFGAALEKIREYNSGKAGE